MVVGVGRVAERKEVSAVTVAGVFGAETALELTPGYVAGGDGRLAVVGDELGGVVEGDEEVAVGVEGGLEVGDEETGGLDFEGGV